MNVAVERSFAEQQDANDPLAALRAERELPQEHQHAHDDEHDRHDLRSVGRVVVAQRDHVSAL